MPWLPAERERIISLFSPAVGVIVGGCRRCLVLVMILLVLVFPMHRGDLLVGREARGFRQRDQGHGSGQGCRGRGFQ